MYCNVVACNTHRQTAHRQTAAHRQTVAQANWPVITLHQRGFNGNLNQPKAPKKGKKKIVKKARKEPASIRLDPDVHAQAKKFAEADHRKNDRN
jgi:hypothetical protein